MWDIDIMFGHTIEVHKYREAGRCYFLKNFFVQAPR